jgi:hypothetical protein
VLVRFEVANFRSILEPVELSMVAVDQDRDEAHSVPNLGESLLPVAGIFGPNASGKSNVIAALVWLVNAVQRSLLAWEEKIPTEPFAGSFGQEHPSSFTIELIIAGVRFEYLVELDQEQVHYEGLFHYPEKKRRRIFEREGNQLKLQRGLGHLSGTRELLTNRTLALSIVRRFDEPLVSDFVHELLAIKRLESVMPDRGIMQHSPSPGALNWWQKSLDDSDVSEAVDASTRTQALALLRLADLGIDDVRVVDKDVLWQSDDFRDEVTGEPVTPKKIQLIHRIQGKKLPFEYGAESDGTRTWFSLIAPLLSAFKTGSLLLFDELNTSLHPTLSAQLIRLFHDPATNPKGTQLVFTSHDTSLLNHLNRDEVWFTEKTESGETKLGALAEFAGERVRKSQNLEKGYLHGRFGALPEIDRTEVLRTLGLIG